MKTTYLFFDQNKNHRVSVILSLVTKLSSVNNSYFITRKITPSSLTRQLLFVKFAGHFVLNSTQGDIQEEGNGITYCPWSDDVKSEITYCSIPRRAKWLLLRLEKRNTFSLTLLVRKRTAFQNF